MPQPQRVYKDEKKRKSKSSTLWIALSLLLSTLVLGWAFSLPFRQPGKSLLSSASSGETPEQTEWSEQIKQRRTQAEEYRQASIARDREFMRSVAKKRRVPTNIPGKQEAKAHWNRHVTLVKRQLNELKQAEEGSLEWQYRQERIQSLGDGPGESP